jgi:hypothetical protein
LLDPERRRKLFRYACVQFRINEQDAEDLLQETALELLRYRSYVRSPEGFVFTVFRARCVRFSGSRRAAYMQSSEPSDGGTELCDAEANCIEEQLALREALNEISSKCPPPDPCVLPRGSELEGSGPHRCARRLERRAHHQPLSQETAGVHGMMEHLDELTHWLYAVKGLAEDQFAAAAAHLSDCFDCADSQLHFGRLDAGLRELALVAGIPNVSEDPFEPSDPFRRRPRVSPRASGARKLTREESVEALEATEHATRRSEGDSRGGQEGRGY